MQKTNLPSMPNPTAVHVRIVKKRRRTAVKRHDQIVDTNQQERVAILLSALIARHLEIDDNREYFLQASAETLWFGTFYSKQDALFAELVLNDAAQDNPRPIQKAFREFEALLHRNGLPLPPRKKGQLF